MGAKEYSIYSLDLMNETYEKDGAQTMTERPFMKRLKCRCSISTRQTPVAEPVRVNRTSIIPGGKQFTITATAGKGGTITPLGIVTIADGLYRTFVMKADEDYKLVDVLVDGVSLGAVELYTFEQISDNHTINAGFKKNGEVEWDNPFTDIADRRMVTAL